MNVTPPPRNAITSNSFTPFILKTASIPTSVKLYQAVPLDRDLQNELCNATLEEPPRWSRDNKLKYDPQYVQYIFQIYQSHTKVQTPDLSLLSGELYDHKSHTWQPLVIPFILWARVPRESSTATATSRGRASKVKLSEGSLSGRRRESHSQRQLTITRTVQDSDLNSVTESVEEGTYIPKPGSEEAKVASWLNRILDAVRPSRSAGPTRRARTRLQTRILADEQRHWSAEFATRPAPADVDLKMKPDIALLQKDPFDPNGPNSWRHVVSFIELTSSEDSPSLRKQVTRKAYTVFVSQPGRRFLIALSIFRGQQFRFHLFDRSGIVHSLAYSLHRQADVLLRVLYMLAFAPKEFVGYDPTIFFSPIVSRCLRLRHSPTIRIGDEEYIITRLIFSSDSIRGWGTLCFAVKKAGSTKEYVVKISWTRIGIRKTLLLRIVSITILFIQISENIN